MYIVTAWKTYRGNKVPGSENYLETEDKASILKNWGPDQDLALLTGSFEFVVFKGPGEDEEIRAEVSLKY